MASIFERMGLVQREESCPSYIETTDEIVTQDSQEPIPEIDSEKIDYNDLISSIYTQGEISEDDSIFQIKAYMDVLPAEMTTARKQMSIAGILGVNKIDIDNLINDGTKRIAVLDSAKSDIIATNDNIIKEAETDIENLKGLIEAAEAKIAEAIRTSATSNDIITSEMETISKLIEFSKGIKESKEEK